MFTGCYVSTMWLKYRDKVTGGSCNYYLHFYIFIFIYFFSTDLVGAQNWS